MASSSSSLPSRCSECRWWEENGDGSQRLCICMEEEEGVTTVSSDERLTGKTKNTTSTKRPFMVSNQFDRLAGDKMKRKLMPIKKWRELIVNKVFRVIKLHDIMVNIKDHQELAHYVEMEEENGNLLNAWLTPIIFEELSKYDLNKDDTYIKPLGKTMSKNGTQYHDFAIVVDKI